MADATSVPVTNEPLNDVLEEARFHYAAAQAAWNRYDDRKAESYAIKALARYAELDARITNGEPPPDQWRG